MARNISKESLEQKIEKVEKAISRNREQYEKLTTELEELHQKQKAIQSEELLKAIAESTRSYEEILRFIQSASEEEEEIDA
ncbi:MAG: ErpK protein [Roseburia sp.]